VVIFSSSLSTAESTAEFGNDDPSSVVCPPCSRLHHTSDSAIQQLTALIRENPMQDDDYMEQEDRMKGSLRPHAEGLKEPMTDSPTRPKKGEEPVTEYRRLHRRRRPHVHRHDCVTPRRTKLWLHASMSKGLTNWLHADAHTKNESAPMKSDQFDTKKTKTDARCSSPPDATRPSDTTSLLSPSFRQHWLSIAFKPLSFKPFCLTPSTCLRHPKIFLLIPQLFNRSPCKQYNNEFKKPQCK